MLKILEKNVPVLLLATDQGCI